MRTRLSWPRLVRKLHRWLGLAVGLQLLVWTGSGLFFALSPIERVRGETEAAEPRSLAVSAERLGSPGDAIRALAVREPGARVIAATLRPLLDEAVYEIEYALDGRAHYVLADATTGKLRGPLTRDEAVAVAVADFAIDAPVAEAILVKDAPGGHEYRDHDLPAWRVSFRHPLGTRIYVAAERGLVTARRNDRWRAFDLLWMLHVMDYATRDDFNSWWLTGFAGVGVVTVVSGFALWALTTPLLRRRRRSQA